jgi:2-polyprenyl-3-methyl-5-hydroxy-6-metoxy-1,4-benzoquinol methylase
MNERQLIEQQVAYYRARAQEYDEWYFRKGRYDRGAKHRAQWFREIGIVEEALREAIRGRVVLELACGTGLWTRHLAEANPRVVAVDASPEAIAINRERVASPNVEYIVSDIFSWAAPERFDAVFFAFWLSHVPPGRLEPFWARVRTMVKGAGRVFFADSLLEQSSTAKNHNPLDASGVVKRKLNDGREFEIVKVFCEPSDLQARLHHLGWKGSVHSTGTFFLYGSLTP